MSLRSSSSYVLKIQALRSDANRAVIHYFEKHEAGIRLVDSDEYLDILLIYLDALFACGEYEVFLQRVEEALILAIDSHVYTLGAEEIFHHLLFRKAAALYNLGKVDGCIHDLKELISIAPSNRLAIRFLKKSLVTRNTQPRQHIRATAIGCFLVSVLIIGIEIMWIRPFRPDWIAVTEVSRNGLFGLGFLVILGGEWWLRRRARLEVSKLVQTIRIKKNRNQREYTRWP